MKKIITFTLISGLLFIAHQTVDAEQIPVDKAEQAAYNFVLNTVLTKSSNPSLKLVWTGTDTKASDNAPYYIFNVGSDGFVIIAGDDGMYPVLGYSTNGCFDVSDIPDGMRILLDSYRQNVYDLRRGQRKEAVSASVKWSSLLSPTGFLTGPVAVVDLKTALWGQNSPFDGSCPIYDSKRCLTGCGATALAILMRHYKYPDMGYGALPEYVTATHGITLPEKTFVESYRWDDMLESYGSGATSAQTGAVAALMVDLGQMIFSDYDPNGTSSLLRDILPGMLKYMKYSNKALQKDRINFTTDKWVKILKDELSAGHPVFYRGDSSVEGGHYFILDGFDSEDRFHFNWGWDGSNNGFFYVSDTDFSSNENAIIGLVPDYSWTAPTSSSPLSYYSNGYSYFGIWSEDAYIENGENATVHVALYNNGTASYEGEVKIALCHADNTVVDLSNTSSFTLDPSYVLKCDFPVKIPSIIDGDKIVTYYKVGTDWVLVDNGDKALPLRYKIPDVISLEYVKDGETKRLLINAMVGMTVSIGGGAPQTITNQSVCIDNPSGEGDFTFSNGHDSYTVHLKF